MKTARKKQIELPYPFVSPLAPEQEARAIALLDGTPDERLALRVLIRRVAYPEEGIAECARQVWSAPLVGKLDENGAMVEPASPFQHVSRQAVYRALRLLRMLGIYDEPKKRRGPAGTNPTQKKCLSPRHEPGVKCPACLRYVKGDMHFGVCEDVCCMAAPCIAAREKRNAPIQVTLDGSEGRSPLVQVRETSGGVILDTTKPFVSDVPVSISIGTREVK